MKLKELVGKLKEILKFLLGCIVRYWKRGTKQKVILIFVSIFLFSFVQATKNMIYLNNRKEERSTSTYTTKIETQQEQNKEEVQEIEVESQEEILEEKQNEIINSVDSNITEQELKNLTKQTLENSVGIYGEIKVYDEDNITMFSIPIPLSLGIDILDVENGTGTSTQIENYNKLKELCTEMSIALYESGQTKKLNFSLAVQNPADMEKIMFLYFNGEEINLK